jgi:Flp pilus assembly protein TadD/DNA polymerase IIIc chi subunit
MGFAGNLGTLTLVEVFQTLNRIQATGALRLVSADGGREVIFAQGEIVGVGFRAGEEGQALLRRLITEQVISPDEAANISSDGRSTAIVASLIEAGVATAGDVEDARQRQALDELHNLFTWDYADFVFHDATPEAPAVEEQVRIAQERPLGISLNALLMESARRSDEWQRFRSVITDDDMVIGPAQGAEADLAAAGGTYPGSAVIPLVDGVRTVGDIVKASVATRFDIYLVIVGLLDQTKLVVLTRSDLIYHGDYLVARQDHARAAMVFRRALAEDATDVDTTKKLASCLERLGDQPTAAGCHGQLALAMLADGQGEQACDHARRATTLAPADPQLRLTLVRCLMGEQDNQGAVSELKRLTGMYLDNGLLEDARGTCLKILEIDGKDEDARRELARIYSQAENDPGSEDVVICVSCSHVNHREAANCAQCNTALHLTCINCGRVVGVSDRICIFCGANPNIIKGRAVQARRAAGGNPATSRMVGRPADVDPGIAAAAPWAEKSSRISSKNAWPRPRPPSRRRAGPMPSASGARWPRSSPTARTCRSASASWSTASMTSMSRPRSSAAIA